MTGGALGSQDLFTSVVTGTGTLLAGALAALYAGPAGLLAGAVLVAAWLLAPPVFLVAFGHVLVAALLAPGGSVSSVLGIEAALGLVLLGDLVSTRAPLPSFALALGCLAGFAMAVLLAVRWLDAVWHVTALLAVAVAFSTYALHRYTVVRFEATDEF